MDAEHEELQRMRRCNRDLVALSTLPLLWLTATKKQIGESLVSVLFDTLQLDAAFILLKGPPDRPPLRVARTRQGAVLPDRVAEWEAAFSPLLNADLETSPINISLPEGNQPLLGLSVAIGFGRAHGVFIAASRRPEFPSETDRLLLNLGTNQLAAVLERKHVEERLLETEARYKLVTRATNDAIWDWDLVTQRMHWNESVATLFGYAAEEVGLDARWKTERVHVEDRARVIDRLNAAIALGETHWSDEYRFERRDGSYAAILDRSYIVYNEQGKATRMIGAMLDLTERKKAEAAKELALKEAGEALQARDEFMSIASHELKTPLTSLSLQLQMLDRTIQRAESSTSASNPTAVIPVANVVRTVRVCERQSKKLSQLLDELLDLTRIRLGKLELRTQEVDLAMTVKEVAERFRDEAQKRGSSLTISAAPGAVVGRWDATRVEQIVTNLLSNAIKYGEGSPIEVAVFGAQSGASSVLEVRDRGMGIPIELQSRIFERFERAVEGHQISGLGLGLYITRQIVEAHGGSIRVRSERGLGSTFTVELPVQVER